MLLLASLPVPLGPAAWAQAPGGTQPQSYSWQLLGIQPLAPPGAGTLAPPTPPPPSQTHLPINLPLTVPTTVATAPRATFELQPTLGFSEEYTDNFQLTTQDKIQNFRSMVTPGLNLLINGPRTQGTVSANLGLAQDSVDSLGSLSVFSGLSASVKHTFDPRLSLTLTDTLTRSDQPSLADQFGLRQQRSTFTSNTLGLSADWFLGPVVAQGYYQLSTFFGQGDTVSQVLGADAGIPLGSLTAVKAGYEFSQSHTSGVTLSATSSDSTGNLVWVSLARQLNASTTGGVSTSYSIQSLDNSRIWNVSLFNTWELPGRLSLSGSFGYSRLSSDAGDFWTISSNTHVTYSFAKATLSAGIIQDFQPTFTQGQNFGIVQTHSYTASFAYELTPFIDTALSAVYSENKPTGVGNSTASPDTNTFSGQAGLVWRLRRWLSMGLDYTYTRYGYGAGSGGTAIENRVALRLTTSY